MKWVSLFCLAFLAACSGKPADDAPPAPREHLLLQPIIGHGPGVEFMDHGTAIGSYAYDFQECGDVSNLEICKGGFIPLVWDEFVNSKRINVENMDIQKVIFPSGGYAIVISKNLSNFTYLYDTDDCVQYLVIENIEETGIQNTEILYRRKGNLCF